MNINLISFLVVAVLVIVVLYKAYNNYYASDPDFGAGTVKFIQEGNVTKEIDVKVADTVSSRAKGLMFAESLPKDMGMLFIYPGETVKKMWMKNTFIPLDMIFVGSNLKIKHIVRNTMPESLNQISSIIPVKYVIEVNAGFASQNNININDEIKIDIK